MYVSLGGVLLLYRLWSSKCFVTQLSTRRIDERRCTSKEVSQQTRKEAQVASSHSSRRRGRRGLQVLGSIPAIKLDKKSHSGSKAGCQML